ncbi:MAG: 2-amino-4-hydroxy-6-hydroxymethyldihydropteridine diphosphokinase [Gaiellaceae bacterium]
MIAYLGLGSNVGDRRKHLMAATQALGARRTSSLYETAPQGDVLDQPDFLNAVVEIETDLGPEDLLIRCKEIESELGRRAGGVRHGPRPIDIDILLLGDLEYESERLRIPHRDLETRRFVLEPLRELAPERVDEAIFAAVADQAVERVEGTLRPTWRDAVEAKDVDALAATLADDAKLRSPITARIPFEGRERVVELMTEVFALLESMRVLRELREGPLQVLEIETRLAGYDVHMVQVLEHDDAGRVRRITLFMRPLPGVANLAAHIGPRLVRRRFGPVVAALVSVPMFALALAARVIDRLSPHFV